MQPDGPGVQRPGLWTRPRRTRIEKNRRTVTPHRCGSPPAVRRPSTIPFEVGRRGRPNRRLWGRWLRLRGTMTKERFHCQSDLGCPQSRFSAAPAICRQLLPVRPGGGAPAIAKGWAERKVKKKYTRSQGRRGKVFSPPGRKGRTDQGTKAPHL